MKYLWEDWKELERLVSERDLVLFLDYDGTLTPIVRHPSLAKLSPIRKRFLRSLVHLEGMEVAIVSGRSLAEIKNLVGLSGLTYAGNHGLEFEGPKIHFVHPEALRTRKLFKMLAQQLDRALTSIPGVFVENKGLTLSVHYRELSDEQVGAARKIFDRVLRPYLSVSRIAVTQGKKVWEVRPSTKWNKGTLILWLLARVIATSPRSALPIYIGDDQTDEDAFKALKDKGIGIKVVDGPDRSSMASHYLRSPSEVYLFLKRLRALKTVGEKFRVRARTA